MLPALVLTAGLGTRLDPLTRLVAKPAVPLSGRTLVERVLAWLKSSGVTRVVLNLHHHPASITGVVGDGAHLGLGVKYSWEPEILGSAGGPRRALPLLEASEFLIVNGDTRCDVDLAAMLRAHVAADADVTLSVVRNPAPDFYNGITLNAKNRVTGFVPRGQAKGTWHFVGIQIVKASVFEALEDGVPASTIGGLYNARVANAGGVYGFKVDAPFLDVGTPRDYLDAALALSGTRGSLDTDGGPVIEAGASVAASATLSDSVVWSASSIGRGAVLDRCIVAGAAVPDGFRAERAVLVPASIVRSADGASVRDGVGVFPL